MYIFSQIICGIGIGFDLFGKTMKNKVFIVLFMAIANTCFTLSYVFTQNWSAACANIIYMARGFWYFFLESKKSPPKKYVLPIIVLLLSYAVSLIFFWNSWFDVFVIVATVSVTIVLAFKNTLMIRLFLVLNSACWLCYNTNAGMPVNMICDILTVLTLIVAIIVYNVVLPRKQEKKALGVCVDSGEEPVLGKEQDGSVSAVTVEATETN